jgi:hypothetical protein
MGQYHYAVNLDKHEFINPHALGCGLKLWEQVANHPGPGPALLLLLACSNGRGGGDITDDDDGNYHPTKNPRGIIGRWAGDRIAVVGDYAEDGDLSSEHVASTIYARCLYPGDKPDPDIKGKRFKDITPRVAKVLEFALDGKFKGDGWRDWVPNTTAGERP